MYFYIYGVIIIWTAELEIINTCVIVKLLELGNAVHQASGIPTYSGNGFEFLNIIFLKYLIRFIMISLYITTSSENKSEQTPYCSISFQITYFFRSFQYIADFASFREERNPGFNKNGSKYRNIKHFLLPLLQWYLRTFLFHIEYE